jgi:hypothetical protein
MPANIAHFLICNKSVKALVAGVWLAIFGILDPGGSLRILALDCLSEGCTWK